MQLYINYSLSLKIPAANSLSLLIHLFYIEHVDLHRYAIIRQLSVIIYSLSNLVTLSTFVL